MGKIDGIVNCKGYLMNSIVFELRYPYKESR